MNPYKFELDNQTAGELLAIFVCASMILTSYVVVRLVLLLFPKHESGISGGAKVVVSLGLAVVASCVVMAAMLVTHILERLG